MAAMKLFLLALIVAVASARVVKLKLPRAADIPLPFPDQHGTVINAGGANMTIDASDNLLTMHDPNFDMSKPGTAIGTFTDVDFEVGHYVLQGKFGIISIEGDGTISLKFYPTAFTITYTPISDTNKCPKSIEKYEITMDKVDLKITGLYADQFHMDDIADAFVNSHASAVTKALNTNLNTDQGHKSYDETMITKVLNQFC